MSLLDTNAEMTSTPAIDDDEDRAEMREEIRQDLAQNFEQTHQLLAGFAQAILPVKFKRLGATSSAAVLPSIATIGSAGCDLCSTDSVIIQPGETALVHTGWSVELPSPFLAIHILPRSGLAKNEKRITVANAPGLIDYDYRGELMVLLHNRNVTPFTVNVGDRIAQMMIVPNLTPFFKFEETTDDLSVTSRGAGGFGSTGVTGA